MLQGKIHLNYIYSPIDVSLLQIKRTVQRIKRETELNDMGSAGGFSNQNPGSTGEPPVEDDPSEIAMLIKTC